MFIEYSVLIYSFLKKASLHHILVPTAHLHTHLPRPLMPIPIFHTHWTTYLSPSHHILSSFYTSITHFPHYFSYHPHHLSFIPHHFPKCMRPKTHGHPHLIIFLTVIHTVIHHTHLHAQVSNFHSTTQSTSLTSTLFTHPVIKLFLFTASLFELPFIPSHTHAACMHVWYSILTSSILCGFMLGSG